MWSDHALGFCGSQRLFKDTTYQAFLKSRFTAISPPGSPTLWATETVPHIDAILVLDIVKYNYCGTRRETIHGWLDHEKARLSSNISVIFVKELTINKKGHGIQFY